MRKVTIFTALLIVVGAIAALLFTTGNPLASAGDKAVRSMAKSFMEDVQFKDFRSSSLYSHPFDRGRLDIGKTLERLYAAKPEFVDVIDYKLVRLDLDKSGERAKTLVRSRYKLLDPRQQKGKAKVREADLVLYWIKRHPECPVGASCQAGVCVDEFEETIYKSIEDKEEEKKKKEKASRLNQDDTSPVADKDKPYKCDATRERIWTMNLDSTLKEKDYRNAR